MNDYSTAFREPIKQTEQRIMQATDAVQQAKDNTEYWSAIQNPARLHSTINARLDRWIGEMRRLQVQSVDTHLLKRKIFGLKLYRAYLRVHSLVSRARLHNILLRLYIIVLRFRNAILLFIQTIFGILAWPWRQAYALLTRILQVVQERINQGSDQHNGQS